MTKSPEEGDVVTEHIPWEHLTTQPPPDRKMLWYGLAGGVVVVCVLFIIISRIGGSSGGELQPVTSLAGVEQTAVAPSPESASGEGSFRTPSTTAVVAAPQVEPALLSEADLLASGGGETLLEAAAVAEWFTLEFFTLDPGEPWGERVTAASGIAIPEESAPLPPKEDTVSYVEWTKVRSVEQTGPDTFRVSILMRRMVAPDGVAFSRLGTETVDVEVRRQRFGTFQAVSLPVLGQLPVEPPQVLPQEMIVRQTDPSGIEWPASVLGSGGP